MRSSPYIWISALLLLALSGCDRGAGEQIRKAREFADAVALNDGARCDSMVATFRLQEYFQNEFVTSELITYVRNIYDHQNKKFKGTARADVDADLKEDLTGGLLLTGDIEDTGLVRVKPTTPGLLPAYFWMVKQQDQPWKVAMITKGEIKVLFK